MTSMDTAGGLLTIDLDALASNWRALSDRAQPAACSAVVKANAYGLGADKAVAALEKAGCRDFFVATLDEALSMRAVTTARIHVLNGLTPGTEDLFAESDLIPVLNSLGQIDAWTAFCRDRDAALEADIHVDTAMSRLGLPGDELAAIAKTPARLDGLKPGHMLSHLASAEEPNNPLNPAQLTAFQAALCMFKGFKGSLANGSGIFLGPDYHADLVRPGAALYGVNPTPGAGNPMSQVVRLQGKILQVRSIDTPNTVGYGATHAVQGPTRIATLGVGYADGFLRCVGNKAHRYKAYMGDVAVPVVGRVSMDLITVDVTGVPENQACPGALVDLIGPNNPVDALADAADTIGYEVLTRLGNRFHRVYEGSRS